MQLLVAGATGFVGRALVPALRAAGHVVRAASRSAKSWPLDVDDDESVRRALDGVDAAFWLVHGLRRGKGYPAWELDVATRFSSSCAARGVHRVIYLGGIDPRAAHARERSTVHLDSRLATGRALASAAGVDVVELRAGMIIGAGSESWIMARDAAARLPAFLAPPWLHAPQQPIAIDDVVTALVRAVSLPAGIYNVPGPEVLTGADIVARTARLLGRAPRFVPVPMFPRALAGRIAPWVTRAHGDVARELFLGMGIDFTVDGDGVFAHMPGHRRVPFDEAAARALACDDVSLAGQLVEALFKRRPSPR